MNSLWILLAAVLVSGCASIHSPYDRYEWCRASGSTRLTSIGPGARDAELCRRQLDEDLDDSTPRILYVPRDIVMTPVIAARGLWGLIGLTPPPF
jgi:hypothetical protein